MVGMLAPISLARKKEGRGKQVESFDSGSGSVEAGGLSNRKSIDSDHPSRRKRIEESHPVQRLDEMAGNEGIGPGSAASSAR